MKKPVHYGNESISALKGAERVRRRPGVIFGSDGLEGCQHAIFEILSNSIDEAREGHGKLITITRRTDLSIEVEDFGRGCPVDYNAAEGCYNWELVFCELYAGGKYHDAEDENYEFSLGLNGLGACATQYASEYMDVAVWRDGCEYRLHFERGENIGGLKKAPSARKKTGSRIRWKPDREVFTDIDAPLSFFSDILKRQAVVNAGVTFRLRYETADGAHTQDFFYANGIMDYIQELAGGGAFTAPRFWRAERRGRDRPDKPEYKVRLSMAFCFSNQKSLIEHYHNSSFLEHGGSPDKALRQALTSSADAHIKSIGKYQKGESKITFLDIADCLIFVSNNYSTATSYENQTKKSINNKFVQEAMADFLKEQFQIYCIENRNEADRIAEQILINKRSRETAEKTRQGLKKKLTGGLDIASRVQKFVDCRTKDLARRELYIVEGDSALGACKLARDAEFQAIIPVRGKILNCLKAEYDKIFKNDIIVDLIKVLGCGVEAGGRHKELSTFDLNALRWSKVIICTDADVDGFQIRTLILSMLYRLTPTLIEKGLCYIAESPLYEITAKNQTWFAYSDREKDEIIKGLPSAKPSISRSKGLGENEPEMMWLTTMNPATRRLIQVLPDEAERTARYFNTLLGDNLAGRKEFIAQHGSSVIRLYQTRSALSCVYFVSQRRIRALLLYQLLYHLRIFYHNRLSDS